MNNNKIWRNARFEISQQDFNTILLNLDQIANQFLLFLSKINNLASKFHLEKYFPVSNKMVRKFPSFGVMSYQQYYFRVVGPKQRKL